MIVVAALAVAFVTTPLREELVGKQEDKQKTIVIATVNGNDISQQQFDRQWNTLPPTIKMQVGKDAILEDLINQELIMQDAKKKEITVSKQETEAFVNQQLAQSQVTLDQFKQQLQSHGMSYEDILSIYQKQLTIARLFEQLPEADFNVTDEEAKAYYENNTDEFYQDEQVTVRHILIMVNDETNKTESQETAQMINETLENNNNSNFCELVENYTMDLGSRDNCGEYTFGKGQMDKAFENASFSMEVGERRVVESDFGYHIIIKTGESEARYLELEDVVQQAQERNVTVLDTIKDLIAQQKMTEFYEEYVSKLRENATITYEKEPINSDGQQLENTTIELNMSDEKLN